tara:strand:+ start:5670 stop:5918 length:249 start_codon:yes stop_codon:yes gene_type:complete
MDGVQPRGGGESARWRAKISQKYRENICDFNFTKKLSQKLSMGGQDWPRFADLSDLSKKSDEEGTTKKARAEHTLHTRKWSI